LHWHSEILDNFTASFLPPNFGMSTARGVLLPQEKDLVLMEIIAILCQIYDRHPRTLAEMSSRIEISCIRTHNSLKPKTTDALSRFSGI